MNDKEGVAKAKVALRNKVAQQTSSTSSISATATSKAPAVNKTQDRVHFDPQNTKERRLKTDAGVDVSDPILFQGVDLKGDSSTASVMGMASGYDLPVYGRFVGSLRKSGYKGHIFLGVAPDVPPAVLSYFRARNVTPMIQEWVNCTYAETNKDDDKKKNGKSIFSKTHCAHPYPDIKVSQLVVFCCCLVSMHSFNDGFVSK